MPSSSPSDTSLRAVMRRLAEALPLGEVAGAEGAPLEATTAATDAPRLITASLLEAPVLRAHRVFGPPREAFAAFLDGTQSSRVVAFPAGVPVVHGTVAGVVRIRRNRRLTTWGHHVERALYVPRALLARERWRSIEEAATAAGLRVVDTTASDPAPTSEHPFALRDAAVHLVQKDREAIEQRLAEAWCAKEHDPLLIDGGISGSERVAISGCTVGVVKSHRTLYAEGEALRTVLALGHAERSSVFRITSTRRATVASWYLRLRDPRGRDPMWGLVRVEVAAPTAGESTRIGERADEVSKWVLAEVSPLALPDPRWDKMVYGVRDCEEFLRAVV
jgi:hypothetical protein